MFYKKFTITVIICLIIMNGCSIFEHIIYNPSVSEGNYLVIQDWNKIHIGMTQQQVEYVLGTPMMHNPFGSNIWYYIYRYVSVHKHVKQQSLILTFNNKDILVNIKKYKLN
ncbi:outer membrane protein assembly factor BamE [Pantoea sp. Mhis]|uniref:outer membrane protein assembly factor BamE n=1 Tax=Pantoea sp. Mhis TaxID=2576759 RepID=UPI00135BA789|nr:outer membrane protein assembly factor BamE [Pantoea sp. Mhis]MXP56616.1 outer membrane protein assembly factor BamE [Pantoea sp. Mhis]